MAAGPCGGAVRAAAAWKQRNDMDFLRGPYNKTFYGRLNACGFAGHDRFWSDGIWSDGIWSDGIWSDGIWSDIAPPLTQAVRVKRSRGLNRRRLPAALMRRRIKATFGTLTNR